MLFSCLIATTIDIGSYCTRFCALENGFLKTSALFCHAESVPTTFVAPFNYAVVTLKRVSTTDG